MESPAVSVVMAVYNCDEYVSLAIESILEQTLTDFEFIIVLDGSNKKTKDIVKSYTDARIRIIEQENRGLPNSLNRGIESARGGYIARMDSDDISIHSRLKKQFNYLETNKDIDVLGGQAVIIDHSGVAVGRSNKPVTSVEVNRLISFTCPVIHPTYFVRRDVYKRLGGYRNITPGQDYDFLIRAHKEKFVVDNLPDEVLFYRVNIRGNTSGNIKKTMIVNGLLKKMYRQSWATPEAFVKIKAVCDSKMSTGFFFQKIYDARNFFIRKYREHKGVRKYLFLLVTVMVCMLNIHIAQNTVSEYLAQKRLHRSSQKGI